MGASHNNLLRVAFASFATKYLGSFKGRLIALWLGLLITLLWGLVFFSLAVQKRHFSEVLFDQQFASAQRIAAELDNKLNERVHVLKGAAANLPADISPARLDAHLARLVALQNVFSAGIMVIGLDGKATADYPILPTRRGTFYGDRDYFTKVVATGRPHIDKPLLSRSLGRSVLPIAVPVLDDTGNVRAVLVGVTDLSAPNFLGIVSEPAMAGKGALFVFSPHDNLIVAATDAKRTMTGAPAPGANLMYDRFVNGFEGSGIATSSTGIPNLYSGKYVLASGWIVMAALPAEVAFQPLNVMRNWLIVMAAALTVMGLVVSRWATRRMFMPLDEAGRVLQQATQSAQANARLPAKRGDGISGLLDNCHALINEHQRTEMALADSEQRFLLLVENAPDAIAVVTRNQFAYVNREAMRLFGAEHKSQLLGQPFIDRSPERFHALIAEQIRVIIERKEALSPTEQKILRLDGSVVYAELSAIPYYYQDEHCALIFARDITDRKLAEEEMRQSRLRVRELVTHIEQAKEAERKRIARDIHDDLGQTLLALRIDVSMLAQRTADLHPRLHSKVSTALRYIDAATKSTRTIINDLRPSVLDLGLLAALEWQAQEFKRRSGIVCELEIHDDKFDRYLDENQSASLFRIVQESLTNIVRHANASEVRITVRNGERNLELTIGDNGVGIADSGRKKENSFGLIGIQERIGALGGEFRVDSAIGRGTMLYCAIPITLPEAESTQLDRPAETTSIEQFRGNSTAGAVSTPVL